MKTKNIILGTVIALCGIAVSSELIYKNILKKKSRYSAQFREL